jgi:hypothetical protein
MAEKALIMRQLFAGQPMLLGGTSQDDTMALGVLAHAITA